MSISTIAIAYRYATAATTICTLEAAGFDVFCPSFHTATMLPHYSLAIGGIQIAVPDDQVVDAHELLRGFVQEDARGAPWTVKAVDALGWYIFGVSSPWPDLALRQPATTAS